MANLIIRKTPALLKRLAEVESAIARLKEILADLESIKRKNLSYENSLVTEVQSAIRKSVGRHDLDGAALMRSVFSRNAAVLTFNDLKDRADEDEQEGMMHLFEGAVLAIRNPLAHKLSELSPELALDYLTFLSMLAKRLDDAKRV
jgi:uncharacterized protein (TIGR02391 family)